MELRALIKLTDILATVLQVTQAYTVRRVCAGLLFYLFIKERIIQKMQSSKLHLLAQNCYVMLLL